MAETKAGIQCQCKSYRCCWRPGFLPSFQLQILSADLRLREAMGIKQLGKFLKSSCASAMSHHSCASEYKAPELAEMINPWVVKVGFFMLVFAGTGILRIPGLPPCETHPNIELVLFQWASATQDESKVGGFKYFLNIFQLVSLGGSQSKISRYKTGHWVTNDCRMICFFSPPLAHHVALGPNPSSKIQPGGRGGHWCEPLPLSVYDCPLDGRRSGNRLNGRGMYRELD